MEEIIEALAAATRGVVGDLGGVLIETSTPATTEVGLVTIFGRAGSTTNVGKVGLVITFSSALDKIGGTVKTNGTPLTDIVGSEDGSVTTVPSIPLSLVGSG